MTYEQELGIFQRTWNMPDYDLGTTVASGDNLRYANAFLTGETISKTPASQFIGWVSRTLDLYFRTNLQLNDQGKYVSSFNSQEFLNSFESLAEAKYLSELAEDQEPNREKYAGASIEDLRVAFSKVISKVNKPLPTLWKERLDKGAMNMQELKTITNNAYDAMSKKYYVDESAEMAGKLTNLVAAYEAMKQLRESRKGFFGWFWKIFNRGQNREEKSYLTELETQVNALNEKGYKTDSITRNLMDRTVLGNSVNAEEKVATKEAPKPQASPKASPVKSNAKPVTMKAVAAKMEDKFDEIPSEICEELYRETSGDKPKADETQQEKEERENREFNRSYALKFLLQGMKDAINELNQQFDEAVANGGDPKKEMQRVVNGIFKLTEGRFSMNLEGSSLERSESFKNATQIIVNNFTAAAIYPNELKEVVNAYIEKNVEVYKEIVDAGKNYSEEIGNYQKRLEEDVVVKVDHEPVFGDDNPFVEDGGVKSEQVSNEPKQPAPTIDMK
jgi:hypothetical protein